MNQDETKERILDAAINLMCEKGFSSTSVRVIAAEAGVSEMTLFRKFKNKQAILDEITEKYTNTFSSSKIFAEDWTYDLETDLKNLSRTYQDFMNKHKNIVRLAYKESGAHDEISEGLTENPKLMRNHLSSYLNEMQKKGLVTNDLNMDEQVLNFMWMNLGHFSAQFISGNQVTKLPTESFIESSIALFARGLRP
ncbi:TetR/AcrR family transcriptional regulator [Salisediminibacterium beveridgei]|uniref:Transcriptional regulator, TetR family n=1 Tax=Salisediminibacterium beveridgei TaxID=632773 RepID=A0A1D7QXU3_9BACI|nr:TetR/AcrR family transcriptional regulator [Salisediminibacterium beveridgei]AOM83820.1 Transcriptional regulator, TetR family [Salisediminibacterium beveridgei]